LVQYAAKEVSVKGWPGDLAWEKRSALPVGSEGGGGQEGTASKKGGIG